MARITISYRREDSMDITGRIFDRLASRYGRDSVFRDIDSIPPGFDFREHISANLADSDLLMVVVGPNWLGRRAGGPPRIEQPTDFVRFEVETALKKNIPVVPLLIGGSEMPLPDELPEGIRDFAFRNAVRIDSGHDFDHHMTVLMRAADRILQLPPHDAAAARTAATAPPGTAPQAPAAAEPADTRLAAPTRRGAIWLSTVGGVLVAQGVLHLVWLVAGIAQAPGQLLPFLQDVWTFGDVIFGFGGIAIGIGTIMGKGWARPSGAALCILGVISEILLFVEYADKELPRIMLAVNALLLPLAVAGVYFFLFRWPEPVRE
jgi:hypothetical protein